MCVIAYKAKNVRFPSKENIVEMWRTNPDGAGLMWRDESTGEVNFVKGFMSRKKFVKWCQRNRKWLDEVECALHFRITTHGGTTPGNCHPFVIAKDADSHLLKGSAKRILMHNGILPIEPRRKDISDSAELALRLGNCADPAYSLGIWNDQLEGNRIIVMDENGTHFFGDAFKPSTLKENEGILYSNLHWEPWLEKQLASVGSWGSLLSCGCFDGSCDTYYDEKSGVFRERFTGNEVPLARVDPNDLSDYDYEIWDARFQSDEFVKSEAEKWCLTPEQYRDCEIEAESCGMCVDDYLTMLREDEEEYAAQYAG